MTAPLIEFKDCTLAYGDTEIIADANMTVQQGETKVVLGPSGVGKSTLLKAALGLLKPKKGKVLVHGQDISKLKEKALAPIRMMMAMVFQHGALFDSMTVGENVSFRLRELKLLDESQIYARTLEVLKFVGLGGAMKLNPAQLSGGMKKRVAIARGLAADPECFLFDEPTVGLDPVNTFNIEQIILKLKKRKATQIIVTHDINSAYKLADRIAMVHGGKLIFEGSAKEIQTSNDIRIQEFLNPAVTQYVL